MAHPVTRALWRLAGAVLVILPLLAIPRWIGSPDSGPGWGAHLQFWGIGGLVIVVLALLAGRLAVRARIPRLRWPVWGDRVLVWGGAVLLAAAATTSVWVAFAANPHMVDEIAQLFQARVFAAGRLAAVPPDYPEFFYIAHTWITSAGWVAQFPPGQPLVLALGLAAGAEWLVNPLVGAAGVPLVFALARGWVRRVHGAARGAPVGDVRVGRRHVQHVHESHAGDHAHRGSVGRDLGARGQGVVALGRGRAPLGGSCGDAALGRSRRGPADRHLAASAAGLAGDGLGRLGGAAGHGRAGLRELAAVRGPLGVRVHRPVWGGT